MGNKFERCVRKVKAKQKGNRLTFNPYAVCKSSIKLGKGKRKK